MAIPNTSTLYGKTPSNPVINTSTLKISKSVGLAYPIKSNPKSGYFAKKSGFDLIKSNLNILLKTELGERFMLPNYGANLKRFLMDPLDETTFTQITKDVRESIGRYLSKVLVQKIQVFETRQNGINVKLFCKYKNEEFSTFETNVRI